MKFVKTAEIGGWETFLSYHKLQLIMIQELMIDWRMDPDSKKFGGGKN